MGPGQGVGHVFPGDDESLVSDLLKAFSLAVARSDPREMAALMCADEAESFLDNVFDPDDSGPAEPVEEPAVRILGVRVFGDVALARFTGSSDDVRTLHFRRDNSRWTVCADAEEDLSLEQLEDEVRQTKPAGASRLGRRLRGLRGKPIGSLSDEDLRVLLAQNEGLDILLPRAVFRLQWDPLLQAGPFPGDLLTAALGVDHGQWRKDPVSLARMRIVVQKVRGMGDLAEHGAPHDEVSNVLAQFLADHPGQ